MDITLQNFDLITRDVYLYQDIDNTSALDFIKNINEIYKKDIELINTNIKQLNQIYQNIDFNFLKDKKNIPDINIYLNTYGGSCYYGYSLYDNIKNINNHCKINIIASGSCMSMGIIILLSVPYEQRKCTKNTTFMIHQASGFSIGKTAEMEEQLKENKRLTEKGFNIIAENTLITKETLEENYNKKEDWFLTAEEALKFKIISEII